MEENQSPSVAPKAWDLKDLEERLKSRGLPVLEKGAKEFFSGLCEWIEFGIKSDDNKVNDLALAVLPPFRDFVNSKLDGISK